MKQPHLTALNIECQVLWIQVVVDQMKAVGCQSLRRAFQRHMQQSKAWAVQAWRRSQVFEMFEDVNAAEEDMMDTMSQQNSTISLLQSQLAAEQEASAGLRKQVQELKEQMSSGGSAARGKGDESEDLMIIAELEEEVEKLKAELESVKKEQGPSTFKNLLVAATDEGAEESEIEAVAVQDQLKKELEQVPLPCP